MHAYRFRILSDESEDFVRDIEILASQTFLDLHEYLVKLLDFKSNELASFSICNSRWYKQCEITLIDMDFGKSDQDDEDDDEPVKKVKMKTVLMADSRLNEFMEDPHQKIIFEYDYMSPQLFFIELMKIVPSESNVIYPICIKSEGVSPRKLKPIIGDDSYLEEDDIFGGIAMNDSGQNYEEGLDDDFTNELGEGFEIENGVEMDAEERFDSNAEESQRT
ncbi:MAG: hypothetical protein WCO63_12080 [Bacteroidota bacterium]